MQFELHIIHRAGIVYKSEDALSHLPTLHGCEDPNDDDILLQCIVHYDHEPCLVHPDAEEYFKLETYVLSEFLPVIPEAVELPFSAEFVEAQKVESLCARLTTTVAEPETEFEIDEKGTLVQRETSARSLQKVVRPRLGRTVFYIDHNSMLDRHPGRRRMYDSMWRVYCWQHMANDVYRWFVACESSRRNR